jgi:hypothetical protein
VDPQPGRSAMTRSSVSKNQPVSATNGNNLRPSARGANPHCASEKRAPGMLRRIKL